ncbi:MAG: TasA family protein [Halolamina sp.]
MPFDPHQPLNRRRLLESAVTVGLSATAAGAGTYSIFSDGETSQLHVGAGTLDLQAGAGANRTIRLEPVDGSDAGVETLPLENVGSVAGNLDLTLSLATCETEDKNNAEDRPCEWEPDTDNAEGTKSQNGQNRQNRLAEALSVEVGFDRDGSDGGEDATVAVPETPAAELPFGERLSTEHTLTGDGSSTDTTQLYVAWRVDDLYEPTNNSGLAYNVAIHLDQR